MINETQKTLVDIAIKVADELERNELLVFLNMGFVQHYSLANNVWSYTHLHHERDIAKERMYSMFMRPDMMYNCTFRGVGEFSELFSPEGVDNIVSDVETESARLDYVDSDALILETVDLMYNDAAFKYGILPMPRKLLTLGEWNHICAITNIIRQARMIDASPATVFNIMFGVESDVGGESKTEPISKIVRKEVEHTTLFDHVLDKNLTRIDYVHDIYGGCGSLQAFGPRGISTLDDDEEEQ